MTSPAVAWEIAQAVGLCAVAACLILCVLAVRPRAAAAGALRVRSHELLGWSALAAAVLHVGLSIGADHRVVEHLKPTAPRYEYAGILALLALLFLTAPAGAAARRRIWPRHRNFQAAHIAAACLLVVALAMHVLTADRYVHGRAQASAYILQSGSVLLAMLRPRAQRQAAERPPPFPVGLAFGRHSRLVLVIVLGALVALLGLLRGGMALALREPFLRRTEGLAVQFPHDKHRAARCCATDNPGWHGSGPDATVTGAQQERDVRIINLRSLLAHGILLMSLAACGGGGPSLSADAGWTAALDELKNTVAASTGYAANAIELLASPVHVRVSITDSRLAQADQATRENTATAVVAALEKSMTANARFASVVEVSVAIIHAPQGSAHGSHIEDVVDFRKGPNQRFALHVT